MYEYKIVPIDKEKWEKRLIDDLNNFYSEENNCYDKIGIVGENIFSLSFDSKNSFNYLRNVQLYSTEEVKKNIFTALCPELESFVSLNLWFNNEENKKENIELYKRLKNYKENNISNNILKLDGNYRITKDCLGRILKYHGKLSFEDKQLNFYNWEDVPFLKNSGEVFLYFKSPLFLSNENSEDSEIKEEEVFYFTMLFKKFDKVDDNEIMLEILNITDKYKKLIKFKKYNEKELNDDNLRLGLFKEIIIKKSNEYIREFEIVDFTEELKGEDILSHYLNLKLYYNFLLKNDLCICSKNEFDNLCNKEINYIKFHLKKDVNVNCFFLERYMKNFRIIENRIYYIPFFLQNSDDKYIISFFNYINECSLKIDKNDVLLCLKHMSDNERFGKLKRNFDFYKKYIFLQKRSLIDILKKSEKKWII